MVIVNHEAQMKELVKVADKDTIAHETLITANRNSDLLGQMLEILLRNEDKLGRLLDLLELKELKATSV